MFELSADEILKVEIKSIKIEIFRKREMISYEVKKICSEFQSFKPLLLDG